MTDADSYEDGVLRRGSPLHDDELERIGSKLSFLGGGVDGIHHTRAQHIATVRKIALGSALAFVGAGFAAIFNHLWR